jgi:hypothetical protein
MSYKLPDFLTQNPEQTVADNLGLLRTISKKCIELREIMGRARPSSRQLLMLPPSIIEDGAEFALTRDQARRVAHELVKFADGLDATLARLAK